MHIPDTFLDAKTALATGTIAAAGLAIALRQAGKTLPPRRVPLLGLAGAFIFAAQMLNFPVASGTSGHLIGSVLAATLLGPWAAIIILSAVLIVQCFMFADGGVTALGANIFNMGMVGGVGGWAIYCVLARLIPGHFGRLVGVAFAAWAGTVLAAIACAGELAASGTAPWRVVFPAMTWVHMFIGVGEAIITAMVFAAVTRTRPDLLDPDLSPLPSSSVRSLALVGLLISLGLAVFVAPFACNWPDGLEWVANKHLSFAGASPTPIPAPMPEYQIPGIGSPALATAIAGALGTLLMFGLALGIARVLTAKTREDGLPPEE